jgi:DNA-damage-inducible protein D
MDSPIDTKIDFVIKALDDRKGKTKGGGEYWRARDIQSVLGYLRWENFENVIKKACMACESAGIDPTNQFRETTKMVTVGSGAQVNQKDYFLSRYACYLVAMNGDTPPKWRLVQRKRILRFKLEDKRCLISSQTPKKESNFERE